MRSQARSSYLNVIARPRITRWSASIRLRQENVTVRLFTEPVGAETIEGGFEVIQDDGVAEAFEDE